MAEASEWETVSYKKHSNNRPHGDSQARSNTHMNSSYRDSNYRNSNYRDSNYRNGNYRNGNSNYRNGNYKNQYTHRQANREISEPRRNNNEYSKYHDRGQYKNEYTKYGGRNSNHRGNYNKYNPVNRPTDYSIEKKVETWGNDLFSEEPQPQPQPKQEVKEPPKWGTGTFSAKDIKPDDVFLESPTKQRSQMVTLKPSTRSDKTSFEGFRKSFEKKLNIDSSSLGPSDNSQSTDVFRSFNKGKSNRNYDRNTGGYSNGNRNYQRRNNYSEKRDVEAVIKRNLIRGVNNGFTGEEILGLLRDEVPRSRGGASLDPKSLIVRTYIRAFTIGDPDIIKFFGNEVEKLKVSTFDTSKYSHKGYCPFHTLAYPCMNQNKESIERAIRLAQEGPLSQSIDNINQYNETAFQALKNSDYYTPEMLETLCKFPQSMAVKLTRSTLNKSSSLRNSKLKELVTLSMLAQPEAVVGEVYDTLMKITAGGVIASNFGVINVLTFVGACFLDLRKEDFGSVLGVEDYLSKFKGQERRLLNQFLSYILSRVLEKFTRLNPDDENDEKKKNLIGLILGEMVKNAYEPAERVLANMMLAATDTSAIWPLFALGQIYYKRCTGLSADHKEDGTIDKVENTDINRSEYFKKAVAIYLDSAQRGKKFNLQKYKFDAQDMVANIGANLPSFTSKEKEKLVENCKEDSNPEDANRIIEYYQHLATFGEAKKDLIMCDYTQDTKTAFNERSMSEEEVSQADQEESKLSNYVSIRKHMKPGSEKDQIDDLVYAFSKVFKEDKNILKKEFNALVYTLCDYMSNKTLMEVALKSIKIVFGRESVELFKSFLGETNKYDVDKVSTLTFDFPNVDVLIESIREYILK